MKKLLSLFSYIFHPIFVPFYSVLLYFSITYFYFSKLEISIILGQVLILTCLIPISIYFLLKSLGVIQSSVMVSKPSERIIPYVINILLLITLKYYVLYNNSAYAINFYIWGLIYSYIALLVFLFFRLKCSAHIALLGSCFLFFVTQLIEHQNANLIGIIALIFIIGFTATSRLFFKAHTSTEIILGFLIGVIPQLFFFSLTYKM